MNSHFGKTGQTSDTRREFLKTTAAAGVALTGTHALGQVSPKAEKKPAPESGKLKITVAGYEYDRVAGLADGRVQIDGCETKFVPAMIGDMNTHIFSGPQSREITEVGLLPFILAIANDNFRDYSLLPIFVLRVFRHKSIFVRTDREITKPADLRGKRVATPGYSSSSLTWIRGVMQHEYGVGPEDIEWVVSVKDSGADITGGPSKQENIIPKGISITEGPKGKDESQLLVDGDVDALFHPNEPKAYIDGNPIVARLFADSRKVEQDYFAKTGIFPIMHTVAIRNDVLKANPWLAKAAFDAYSQSKQMAYETLKKTAAYFISLPWIAQQAEETRKLMGENYWPYGIDPNLKTLNALLQYSHEQGLAKRKLKIEDLFHPSTLKLQEEMPS